MKKLIALILCAVVTIGLFAGCGGKGGKTDAPDGFSVGFAKADITPSLDWDLGLVGFNNQSTRRGEGVASPLMATCAAFTDEEGSTVVLISWDLLHSTEELTTVIRQAITEELGIEGQYIQFTADHIHNGPNTNIGKDPDGVFYYDFMAETCTQMVKEALNDRKAATMETAFCRPEGLNFQRYYILKDGTHIGKTGNPSDSYYGHMATVDNMMQIVKFTREGGKDVVMVNWGAHYKGGVEGQYNMYSSDMFGVIRDTLLEQTGCETLFIQGGTGDTASSSELTWERTKENQDYIATGTNLAKAAMEAMENMTPAQTGKVRLTASEFHIPTNDMTYHLYTWGFGDVGFVMAPYEMFQGSAIKLRNESPFPMTFIATLANASDNKFYLPDAPAYHAESPYGVSEKYVEGDSELFHEEYMRLLKETFTAIGGEEKEKAEGYITDRSPKKDETPYQNPAPGADNLITPVKNNLFQINLLYEGKLKMMLVEGEELANKIAQLPTFYAVLDMRSIIVDIAQ